MRHDAGPADLASMTAVCREPYGVWLDSALVHRELGAVSLAGSDPFLVLRSRGRSTEIWTRGGTHRTAGDPFETLRLVLREVRGRGASGGAMGYLAYELGRHIEHLPREALADLMLPEMYLCFYESVARIDPRPLAPPVPRVSPLQDLYVLPATFSEEGYKTAVRRALDYIVAGDIYQVNLSQRFSVPFRGDPVEAYCDLRRSNPAPFAAYLNFPEVRVLSASPERFLQLDPETRMVNTRPIKGTRPRGRTEEEDSALAAELLASEKDRAENVMIVDLERNDLGRIAEIGSVRVPALCELESYATVHHLTSAVVARLRDGLDEVDLLRATFPGGSITGAPKIRAMEIIDELEPTERSVYTGAIGHIGFDGSVNFNIAIRTILVKGETAYFQTGGGIVADSDPEREYEETLYKGAALARVLVSAPEPAVGRVLL